MSRDAYYAVARGMRYAFITGPIVRRAMFGIFWIVVSIALVVICLFSQFLGRFESVAIFLAGFLLYHGGRRLLVNIKKYRECI